MVHYVENICGVFRNQALACFFRISCFCAVVHNGLGGNQGFSASLTWQAPIDKKQIWNAFTFVDYGRVFGDERTVVDHTLVSTGLGVTASYKNFYSSLTLGIPLKREFKSQTEKVDKTRIHFNCSMTF